MLKASIFIPEELHWDILKRLPVESLCRFGSVCKSWYSLISSRLFIKAHQATKQVEATRYLLQNDESFVIHRENKGICILYREDPNKNLFTVQKQLHRSHYARLLDVVHGAVFFMYTSLYLTRKFIVFWNPTLRREVSARLPLGCGYNFMGGGYDATNNDFKAVWVPPSNKLANQASRYYKVFSAPAGVWKPCNWTLPELCFENITELQSVGCFFNGDIYWIACKDDWGYVLMYFDCENEEFGRMELPQHLRTLSEWRKLVVNEVGLLSLVRSGRGRRTAYGVRL